MESVIVPLHHASGAPAPQPQTALVHSPGLSNYMKQYSHVNPNDFTADMSTVSGTASAESASSAPSEGETMAFSSDGTRLVGMSTRGVTPESSASQYRADLELLDSVSTMTITYPTLFDRVCVCVCVCEREREK